MKIKFYNYNVYLNETQPTVFLNGLNETEQINKAVKAFTDIAPDMTLYIPANGITKPDGTVEIKPDKNCNLQTAIAKYRIIWRRRALAIADCILFWIPDENNLDTAVFAEFGEWIARKPKQIVLGHSENAKNTEYMDILYESHYIACEIYGHKSHYDTYETHCGTNVAVQSLEEAVKETARKAADFKLIREHASIYNDALSDMIKCRQLYKQI